jgi:aspartate kinase
MKNVASILQQQGVKSLLIVVSALGKTTNALENVVNLHAQGQTQAALEALHAIQQGHEQILQDLGISKEHTIYADLHDTFMDAEWVLEEPPHDDFDYMYDQIVCIGELASTKMLAAYLQHLGLACTWVDVRDCIRTDNNYRDANVDWSLTEKQIQQRIPKLLAQGWVLTQGFLGSSSENFSTTLGREGSDYTAAIFSYCLNAQRMSIWKDVPGVLAADPRKFDNPPKLDLVSYEEAIEMTYYGAQVIHPKTLQPLQSKNIPLWVRSFVQPDSAGTVVSSQTGLSYPPIFVVKEQQALLKISAKDFHFIDEERFARLFSSLAQHRIKVNMTQNTALGFAIAVNDQPKRLELLMAELAAEYHLELIRGLALLTIRHGDDALFNQQAQGKQILLEERIGPTAKLLYPV